MIVIPERSPAFSAADVYTLALKRMPDIFRRRFPASVGEEPNVEALMTAVAVVMNEEIKKARQAS